MNIMNVKAVDPSMKRLVALGGAASLLVLCLYIMTPLLQMPAYRPGPYPATVTEWFTLFQRSWFTGLFCLGLSDIVITIASVFLTLSLCVVLLPAVGKAIPAAALALVVIGTAVYLASNVAFPMLSLSSQYAAATTDARRSAIEAAGLAMTAKSEGLGLALVWSAAFMISVGMLGIFGKVVSFFGILGFPLLIASLPFAGYTSAGPATAVRTTIVLVTYIGGGLGSVAWYLITGIKLIRLGFAKPEPDEAKYSE